MAVSIAQGFGFRKEWLEDALYNIEDKPFLFNKEYNEQAQLIFGIGKNKVMSLESWLKFIGIIEKIPDGYGLTELGKLIKKYDPYFKNKGTWWVIHIILSMKKSKVDIWNYYSNYWFKNTPFDRQELFDFFEEKCTTSSKRSIANGMNAVLSSIKNTPIYDLGICIEADDGKLYRKAPDTKELHHLITAFAIVKWAQDYKCISISYEELYSTMDCIPKILFISQYSFRRYVEMISDTYERKLMILNRSHNQDIIEVLITNPNRVLELYYLQTILRYQPLEGLQKILNNY